MIDSFAKDNKISVVEINDYDKDAPDSVIVSSVEDVHNRVAAAEERIKETDGLTEKTFWESVDKHMDTL